MPNFSIGTEIKDELKEFRQSHIRLASTQEIHDEGVRFGRAKESGYYFNQLEMISIIDLYYNSKFQSGLRDRLGQRKIFMNVGKFRCDVAAKQIDIEPRDFMFMPDPYADPFTAFFLQKDFHEWLKQNDSRDEDDSSFSSLVDKTIDSFPRYGTVVLKKVKNQLKFMPLQNLRNEQTASSLLTADYVIEEHPDMRGYEIEAMAGSGWNLNNFMLKFNEKRTVFERYGHVPVAWLMIQNGEATPDSQSSAWRETVDSLVYAAEPTSPMNPTQPTERDMHVFYAAEVKAGDRPYREKHWARQQGRWMGIGVMEDLVEDQEAKNIIVNLQRRSLHWSSKRLMQATSTELVGKNLVRDVSDGDVLEVGPGGMMTPIDLSNKSNVEFSQFLGEWENSSNQKAFTYEVSVLNSGSARTAYRLAAFMSQVAQAYFQRKRRKLLVLFRDVIEDFILPQFYRDMGNEERVVFLMSGERGFETLKAASVEWAKSETARLSLLKGKSVNSGMLSSVRAQFENARQLPFKLPKDAYKNSSAKFDFVTGDDDDLVDAKGMIANLTSIYQALAAQGDPRAEKILQRIAEIGGVNIDEFGPSPTKSPIQPANGQPSSPNVQTTNENQPTPQEVTVAQAAG